MKILLLSLLFFSSLFSNSFKTTTQTLVDGSIKDRTLVIEKLSENYSQDERLIPLFNSLLHSKLYYIKAANTLVYLLKKDEDKYYVQTVFSRQILDVMDKSDFKKIRTNNRLRSIIRHKLSELNLLKGDEKRRLHAAHNIANNLTQKTLPLIIKALKTEKISQIREILIESQDIIFAKYTQGETQKKAIISLAESVSQRSIQALKSIQTNNKELKSLIAHSIHKIEGTRSLYSYIEKAFFGLSLGSILLLAALGLSITFGVMKVINMAHGELIMLGAYATFAVQQLFPSLIEYSLLIAIPVAFIVSGLVGILIERFVIHHLYSRPLETLLATFGISLVLQQLVRSVYSPLNQNVQTPQWMSGALEINSALSLTYTRLYIVIFAIIVFLGVLFILKKTSLGLKVRAVTQNRSMAQAMGIKTGLIDALTFGFGSGIAGIAGVALSQLTNVGPNLGQSYIVDSFMVVVFGGVGNLWGTFIGAMSIGELNKFLEPSLGAILTKVLILILIILFIQKKPRGLFPQKGRDAED